MSYWRFYYHVVWTTHRREPLIDGVRSQIIEESLHAVSIKEGAYVHAIGFMPDHVHVALSIPPKISVATFIQRVKGSSSYLVNMSGDPSLGGQFKWQQDYGAISFGEGSLERVTAYVRNQADHHMKNQLWAALELEELMPNRRAGSASPGLKSGSNTTKSLRD